MTYGRAIRHASLPGRFLRPQRNSSHGLLAPSNVIAASACRLAACLSRRDAISHHSPYAASKSVIATCSRQRQLGSSRGV